MVCRCDMESCYEQQRTDQTAKAALQSLGFPYYEDGPAKEAKDSHNNHPSQV